MIDPHIQALGHHPIGARVRIDAAALPSSDADLGVGDWYVDQVVGRCGVSYRLTRRWGDPWQIEVFGRFVSLA